MNRSCFNTPMCGYMAECPDCEGCDDCCRCKFDCPACFEEREMCRCETAEESVYGPMEEQ